MKFKTILNEPKALSYIAQKLIVTIKSSYNLGINQITILLFQVTVFNLRWGRFGPTYNIQLQQFVFLLLFVFLLFFYSFLLSTTPFQTSFPAPHSVQSGNSYGSHTGS